MDTQGEPDTRKPTRLANFAVVRLVSRRREASLMRALVTGVSGFVGAHLAEHLIASGDEVAGLSVSGRWPDGLPELERRVRIDRCNLAAIDETELADLIVRKKPDAIYHLAAQANPQASVADPRGTWALNLGGALNLLEAVKRTGLRPRVVLVGSGVSYGNPPMELMPVNESCPVRPNNPYAASKAAADLLGIQYVLAHGADIVLARPFNHAGPRQSSSYVLSALARQVAEVEAGRKPRVEVGNLEIVRDFTDVRDIVRGYRLLVERGTAGEIYNLGTGQGTKLTDALATLTSLARAPIDVHVDPARVRPVDQPLLVADPSKLRAATGWEPGYPIAQTLADMLKFWRDMVACEA
jgi:GDP-4-dehydro-6-deoxy-D-mannose reductase